MVCSEASGCNDSAWPRGGARRRVAARGGAWRRVAARAWRRVAAPVLVTMNDRVGGARVRDHPLLLPRSIDAKEYYRCRQFLPPTTTHQVPHETEGRPSARVHFFVRSVAASMEVDAVAVEAGDVDDGAEEVEVYEVDEFEGELVSPLGAPGSGRPTPSTRAMTDSAIDLDDEELDEDGRRKLQEFYDADYQSPCMVRPPLGNQDAPALAPAVFAPISAAERANRSLCSLVCAGTSTRRALRHTVSCPARTCLAL
jgi:hypothetical protein